MDQYVIDVEIPVLYIDLVGIITLLRDSGDEDITHYADELQKIIDKELTPKDDNPSLEQLELELEEMKNLHATANNDYHYALEQIRFLEVQIKKKSEQKSKQKQNKANKNDTTRS